MNIEKFLHRHLSIPLFKAEKEYFFFLEKKRRLGSYHVIHLKRCELLPDKNGRLEVGYFESFESLLKFTREKYGQVKLCQHCCKIISELDN